MKTRNEARGSTQGTIGLALGAAAIAFGCSSSDSGTGAPPSQPASDNGGSIALTSPPYRATITGRLKDVDPTKARLAHDAYARSIRAAVPQHLAFLGKTSVATGATDPAQVILIDSWEQSAAMVSFYSDPKTRAALDALLDQPVVETWQHPADWAEWGSGSYQNAATLPVFLIRTRAARKPVAVDESRLTHNRVAGGESEAKAQSLSDVAHMVHLGLDDTSQIFFFDLWKDTQKAGQFFGDPSTQSGGAEVFGGPPDVAIFAGTSWTQWDTSGPAPGPLDGTWSVTSLTCDGKEQQLGVFTLDVYGGSGRFVQEFGPTCKVELDEEYRYPDPSKFVIDAKTANCNPSDGCGAIFGGAACPPVPPSTDFSYTVSGDTLTFRRVAATPADPCPAGAQIVFTMKKKS